MNAAVVREAHPTASIVRFFTFLPTTVFEIFLEKAIWRDFEILLVARGLALALTMIPFFVLSAKVMNSFPAGLVYETVLE